MATIVGGVRIGVSRWSLAGVVQVMHHLLRGSCRGDPGSLQVPRRGGAGAASPASEGRSGQGLRALGLSPRGRVVVLGLGAALAEVSYGCCGILVGGIRRFRARSQR